MSAGEMSGRLLALPAELLRMVIEQEPIGALELGRLEMASPAFRGAIDDAVWKQAFLKHRHRNAIDEPSCWKEEYARREAWSHSWRQLLGPSPSARLAGTMSPHTQELYRFVRKMLTGNSPASPLRLRSSTHVVDAASDDAGCFKTIRAALAVAQPFDKVLVKPGVYRETLKLQRSVEIVGTGTIGSTVIDSVDGPTIETTSRISFRLSNLSIQQHPRLPSTGAMSGAVLVKCSGIAVIEECSISSETGHCIVVEGGDSFAYIMHNVIHEAKGFGVLVCDSARGLVEDNIIYHNGCAGVAILSGGDPIVCKNKIHDGLDSGVLVSEKGRGRIERNDIFGNRRAGVAILREGAPLVRRNRIHNGHDSGVLICENGKGAIVENEIFANEKACVAIGRGGASQITGNTIRDGNGGSLLCLSLHSKGLITLNVIHQRPNAVLQVPEPMMSEVREHNLIRYDQELGVEVKDLSDLPMRSCPEKE